MQTLNNCFLYKQCITKSNIFKDHPLFQYSRTLSIDYTDLLSLNCKTVQIIDQEINNCNKCNHLHLYININLTQNITFKPNHTTNDTYIQHLHSTSPYTAYTQDLSHPTINLQHSHEIYIDLHRKGYEYVESIESQTKC